MPSHLPPRPPDEATVVRVQARGVIALPPELRKSDLFAVVERPDGVIELRPQVTIDASQQWFWTERWQRMEREAQEDIDAGRVHRYDSSEEILADFKKHRKQIRARADS